MLLWISIASTRSQSMVRKHWNIYELSVCKRSEQEIREIRTERVERKNDKEKVIWRHSNQPADKEKEKSVLHCDEENKRKNQRKHRIKLEENDKEDRLPPKWNKQNSHTQHSLSESAYSHHERCINYMWIDGKKERSSYNHQTSFFSCFVRTRPNPLELVHSLSLSLA